jgi:short-subunit dehydrogenase
VFVKSFSDALRYEYQRDGITIQHLSPLFVNTKMNAFSHRLQATSLFVPDAATYAHNAVNTLGKVNTTTGYWAHGLQVSVTSVYIPKYIPQTMKMYITTVKKLHFVKFTQPIHLKLQ